MRQTVHALRSFELLTFIDITTGAMQEVFNKITCGWIGRGVLFEFSFEFAYELSCARIC